MDLFYYEKNCLYIRYVSTLAHLLSCISECFYSISLVIYYMKSTSASTFLDFSNKSGYLLSVAKESCK